MLDSLRAYVNNLPDLALWGVPVAGGLVCGVAYLIGRRMLSPPPAPVPAEAAEALMPGGVAFEGVSRDRRTAPRRKGGSVEVVMNLKDGEPHVSGWVIDRSMGGLCILAEATIAEGTVLRLRPRTKGETHPWTEVTVRSCRQDGTRFELGCQFHRTPNWNLLLQFG